ncbi:cytokine-dependent hematopoietic cell linker [Xyrichtys novacula]|uniref:Cytokine-dependent hematopoietic cell linker n=1 Tax=Xyrichtys novacula TaxID=13765 RepID=A0AAV1FDG3_XYRNO|nr:cytokine-dependent hematopoietic cell linker [Xyrichtys novacula]
MDGSPRNRKINQRCGGYNNVFEPEYDVVDDQEEVLNVRIFPARPIHEEREYADRNLPRSSSAHSLSSLAAGNSNTYPREIQLNPTAGPAINRDLKPGRKKTTRLGKANLKEDVTTDSPPRPQKSTYLTNVYMLCPPSAQPFASELVSRLSALALHEPCRKGGQRATRQGGFSQQSRDPERADHASTPHTNQRHSLDLETHDIEKSNHPLLLKERVSSKRHHHEWPQTKEDFDQHDFVPMEKPQQTYCQEDWYIGPCNRADAEHALHLVNKDGAFLVRDCSINTDSQPLVLAVYYGKKVYNVKIRYMENSSKYVLGTGQRQNDMFDSVADIIKFHSIFPITLISGRSIPGSRCPENCVLTCSVTKSDVDQLLQ